MKTQCILVGYVNEIGPQLGGTSPVKTRTLSWLSKVAEGKLDIKD